MRRASLADRALRVLEQNDAGRFFRPGPKLYPFQWNWDSALIAIGLARVDPARGREEVRSLVPAAVGPYRVRRARGPACKVVKAWVP